jgi:hypothetical protein
LTFLAPQLNENFADGKVKGKSRPGRVKKAGASCNGSVTSLRAKAKKASGERAKMYHWCANMKSGKKKKTNEVITNTNIKAKGASTTNLVNGGKPVPAGKEDKLLGTRVGKLGQMEVYKFDQGRESAYSVFDPKTRTSQLTVSGHNKPHAFEIFGVYAGPDNKTRAADLYVWLIRELGLTLVSDNKQSSGGQRVWQELQKRFGRSINIHGFDTKTNQPINLSALDSDETHASQAEIDSAEPGFKRELQNRAKNIRLVASPR